MSSICGLNMNPLTLSFEQEEARRSSLIERMRTPEGARMVVADSFYGRGNAKCRHCSTIVEYNIADRAVTVQPIQVQIGTCPPQLGFSFRMPCPSGDGSIDLGTFCEFLGLHPKKYGDRYVSSERLVGYLSDIELLAENAAHILNF